ncbi:MAG: hypothetical protein IPM32_02295 [Ignavibacteriae bacterium]|nr:hypothetical protein [Ignavibacteriota bacterium]
MKRIVNITLILILFIFFESCETNPIDSNYYELSGFVYDKIYWDSTPNIRENAAVVLDRDTVYTNLEGKYVFPKVKEGVHTINLLLSHPQYSPTIIFRNDINVKSNMTYNIELVKGKDDYFPINSEFEKIFNYITYNFASLYFRSGLAFWKLNNIQSFEDKIIYEVEEKLVYNFTTDNWLTSKKDSSELTFQIVEDSSNLITLRNLSYWVVSFNRYNSFIQGDTIKISKYGQDIITIKKDVGIYKLDYKSSSWGTKYSLIK